MNKDNSLPKGFLASGIYSGIRKNKTKKDLALLFFPESADVAGVYTTNQVYGACIEVSKENLMKAKKSKALIVNSGNANTCNKNGIESAIEMIDLVSHQLGISREEVLIAQTGVIGEEMPLEPIRNNVGVLVESLKNNNILDFASAIMTTDTHEKISSNEIKLPGGTGKIVAVAKGSGMINPKMATMLCFIMTDINIDKGLMEKAFKAVISDTLNMVSVDGDTSTNDMALIINTNLASNFKIETQESVEYLSFYNALEEVLSDISKMIARDGEGATKLIISQVVNAVDKNCAQKIAKNIIMSNLLKAAMFASDANWGRILCAIGNVDCFLDVSKIDVSLKSERGEVKVCKNGYGEKFDNKYASQVLDCKEVEILVDLKSGDYKACAYGCDLTYEYVKINAEYRT